MCFDAACFCPEWALQTPQTGRIPFINLFIASVLQEAKYAKWEAVDANLKAQIREALVRTLSSPVRLPSGMHPMLNIVHVSTLSGRSPDHPRPASPARQRVNTAGIHLAPGDIVALPNASLPQSPLGSKRCLRVLLPSRAHLRQFRHNAIIEVRLACW